MSPHPATKTSPPARPPSSSPEAPHPLVLATATPLSTPVPPAAAIAVVRIAALPHGFAPARASRKFADRRFAPVKSTPRKSAPLKSARSSAWPRYDRPRDAGSCGVPDSSLTGVPLAPAGCLCATDVPASRGSSSPSSKDSGRTLRSAIDSRSGCARPGGRSAVPARAEATEVDPLSSSEVAMPYPTTCG